MLQASRSSAIHAKAQPPLSRANPEGPVEIGTTYSVLINVKNPNDVPLSVTISLSEEGAKTEYSDSAAAPQSQTQVIPADGEITFTFSNYSPLMEMDETHRKRCSGACSKHSHTYFYPLERDKNVILYVFSSLRMLWLNFRLAFWLGSAPADSKSQAQS